MLGTARVHRRPSLRQLAALTTKNKFSRKQPPPHHGLLGRVVLDVDRSARVGCLPCLNDPLLDTIHPWECNAQGKVDKRHRSVFWGLPSVDSICQACGTLQAAIINPPPRITTEWPPQVPSKVAIIAVKLTAHPSLWGQTLWRHNNC